MSGTGVIPPRTTSAPLGKVPFVPTLYRDPQRGPAQPFVAGRPPLPASAATAHSASPADREEVSKSPAAPTSATPPPAASTPEPERRAASPAAEDAAPLPPPSSTMYDEDDDGIDEGVESEELAPQIYSTVFMRQLKRELGSDPFCDELRIFANLLWEKLPEGERQAQPTTAWSRDGLFRDTEQIKRPKERKLTNQVMGILARLTPENYKTLEEELLSLPIRQSTKEQIEMVVNTIYMKAVRPEDAPYVELYMKLVVALVGHTGSSGVGRTICRAIVENCQQQFEGSKFVLKDEEKFHQDGTPLDQEEIDYKKKMLKDKLKANITFLGHLFIHHLVQEKVVNLVLYQLMYGDQSRPKRGRHKPEDYEIEMFCELFKKVGPHLSEKTLNGEHWPTYLSSMQTLMQTTKNMRIRFMLEDTLQFYNSGWKGKQRPNAGPMKLDEQQRHDLEEKLRQSAEVDRALQEKKLGIRSTPRTPVPVVVAKLEPRLPEKTDILEPMSHFVRAAPESRGNPEVLQPITDFLKRLPAPEARRDYFGWWLERSITLVKCSDERDALGDALQRLITAKVFTPEDALDLVDSRLKEFAEKGTFEDNPKLFSNWASVVYKDKSGRFGLDMHTKFLGHLVAAQRPVDEIVKFIITVLEEGASKIYAYSSKNPVRFRILPQLLRYESNNDDGEDGRDDLLLALDNRIDAEAGQTKSESVEVVEVKAFNSLCDDAIKEVQSMLTTHPYRAEIGTAMMAVSAIFTYARFDVVNRLDKYKEFFSQQLRQNNHRSPEFNLSLLTEICETWKELEQTPEKSLAHTVHWLTANRFVLAPIVDTWKAQLKAEGPAGEEVLRKLTL